MGRGFLLCDKYIGEDRAVARNMRFWGETSFLFFSYVFSSTHLKASTYPYSPESKLEVFRWSRFIWLDTARFRRSRLASQANRVSLVLWLSLLPLFGHSEHFRVPDFGRCHVLRHRTRRFFALSQRESDLWASEHHAVFREFAWWWWWWWCSLFEQYRFFVLLFQFNTQLSSKSLLSILRPHSLAPIHDHARRPIRFRRDAANRRSFRSNAGSDPGDLEPSGRIGRVECAQPRLLQQSVGQRMGFESCDVLEDDWRNDGLRGDVWRESVGVWERKRWWCRFEYVNRYAITSGKEMEFNPVAWQVHGCVKEESVGRRNGREMGMKKERREGVGMENGMSELLSQSLNESMKGENKQNF